MAGNDRGMFVLAAATTPSITIAGITDGGVSPGIKQTIERGNLTDAQAIFVHEIMASATISTIDLSLLASCGYSGCEIAALAMYWEQFAQFGTRQSGGSSKILFASGLMLPTTTRASQGQTANTSFQVHAVSSDGVTAPVTVAGSQSTPAGAGVGNGYTIGPASINGTSFEMADTSIEWGMQAVVKACDGHVYPTIANIGTRDTTINLVTEQLSADALLGLDSVAQGATDSVVYFRRKAADGAGNVADATEQHIAVSIAAGSIMIKEISSDRRTIQITPRDDGTNPTVAIDTTAAIS